MTSTLSRRGTSGREVAYAAAGPPVVKTTVIRAQEMARSGAIGPDSVADTAAAAGKPLAATAEKLQQWPAAGPLATDRQRSRHQPVCPGAGGQQSLPAQHQGAGAAPAGPVP
jgi:hypothetical protein